MNPGEVWQFSDGTLRLVLSNATYNATGLAITCPLIEDPPPGFETFRIPTRWGIARVDRLFTHPRRWLSRAVGRLGDDQIAAVRGHLRFLLLRD